MQSGNVLVLGWLFPIYELHLLWSGWVDPEGWWQCYIRKPTLRAYAWGGPFIHPSWGCRPLSQRQSEMFEFPCAVTREVKRRHYYPSSSSDHSYLHTAGGLNHIWSEQSLPLKIWSCKVICFAGGKTEKLLDKACWWWWITPRRKWWVSIDCLAALPLVFVTVTKQVAMDAEVSISTLTRLHFHLNWWSSQVIREVLALILILMQEASRYCLSALRKLIWVKTRFESFLQFLLLDILSDIFVKWATTNVEEKCLYHFIDLFSSKFIYLSINMYFKLPVFVPLWFNLQLQIAGLASLSLIKFHLYLNRYMIGAKSISV